MKSRRLVLLLCVLGCALAPPPPPLATVTVERSRALQGQRLVEAIESFRAEGLRIVYSSAVVDRALRVVADPLRTDPRSALAEILRPHGLELRESSAGVLLIVLAEPPQPRPPTLSDYSDEIVVTPSTRSVIREEPAATRSLRSDDALLAPRIGGDVTRSIELLPGVVAADNTAAFHVRGGLTEDVGLIFDGIELYEPYHLPAFQSPFSTVDGDIVDRIDLYGGGWTSDLGDRHGGFVRMASTEMADGSRGTGQIGSINSRISYGAPLAGGRSSWLISARAWYPELFSRSIELGEEGFSPRFADAYVKFSRRVGPQSVLTVHGLLAGDDLEFNEIDGNEVVDTSTRSGYGWARLIRALPAGLTTETVLSIGRFESDRNGVSEPEDDPVVVRDIRSVDLLGLRHDLTWQHGPVHQLRAGVDVRYLDARYRYEGGQSGPTAIDPDGSSAAAYVAYRVRLHEKLSTELGLRWDRQTYTRESQLSPRFNAVWRPSARTSIRVGAGLFHQSQRIHELQVEDGEFDFRPAERSHQHELTVEHRLPGGVQLRLDAYDRRLTRIRPRYENFFNPIELFPETEADRLLIAPERARLRGVELLVRGRSRGSFDWWAAYTWSLAQDVEGGIKVPRSWDQPHGARFLVGWRIADRWRIALSGAAHSGWPTTPVGARLVDGEAELVLGPRNGTRFDDYARLDFKASRWFDTPRGRLRVDLEIVNLTDHRNVCCVDEAEAFLRPDGSAAVRRDLEYWLRITPTVNVAWEF